MQPLFLVPRLKLLQLLLLFYYNRSTNKSLSPTPFDYFNYCSHDKIVGQWNHQKAKSGNVTTILVPGLLIPFQSTKHIAVTLVYNGCPKDLRWIEGYQWYCQTSGPQIFQLHKQLITTIQGSMSIEDYYTKIRTI